MANEEAEGERRRMTKRRKARGGRRRRGERRKEENEEGDEEDTITRPRSSDPSRERKEEVPVSRSTLRLPWK